MPAMRQVRIAGIVAFGLLAAALLRGSQPRMASVTLARADRGTLTAQVSPSETARQAGWRHRIEAKQAADRALEALEAWDPQAFAGRGDQTRFDELMRQDRHCDLSRARAAARQAAELARTPAETYRAALLLAYLDS